ncbi:ABC transporter ATP-binding protein [Burkholderia sp. Bp9090]|uniref:ATP-binding cassette domain-containing protein n=1 Tax=Burkholderia sp. Bp9090 TaxID=2184567 RepID=UPI000F5E092A|nr:ABC transporter ATP-binding protein [Burkholderia sp. Bp9090]RQZ41215.1 ABC transporter ATP-binding protein [Burkholderia sp. Bp9090]
MKVWEILHNLGETLLLLWRAAPRALSLAIMSNLVVGVIPSVLLYINAQLIERLTSNAAAAAVMALVIAYFILGGFHDGLNAISSFIVDSLGDSARMLLKRDVNSIVATFPNLGIHEDADLRETAILAAGASDQVGELVLHLYAVCIGTVMIIPILLLTGQTAWWIPFLVLAGMVPPLLFRARAERESWNVQEHHAATFNDLRLLERVLTQPEFAKDLRIYRMQERLLAKWQGLYDNYLETIKRVRTRNALKLAATSLAASVCLGLPLYAVIDGFQLGKFSIAQLAFLLGALVQLKDGLAAIVYNFGDLLRVSYAVRPFRKLIALHAAQQKQAVDPARRPPPVRETSAAAPCVTLRNVGLRYGDAEHAALDQIGLEIRDREVIAIVGENGAGKTTLLKLLCGLYEPTTGVLAWSTAHHPPRVVGVFQDFARFPLDVRENLVEHDMQQADEYLKAVGLEFLGRRPDTPLTTETAGGTDISGGQWQRLAIARAMAHADEADLLVFDEPTSALDPESEADIMRLILELAEQRTTVIVSHRLALTRFVDRIVVLDKGHLVEEGSHDELIARNGKYARMFHSQAMFYHDSVPDGPAAIRRSDVLVGRNSKGFDRRRPR